MGIVVESVLYRCATLKVRQQEIVADLMHLHVQLDNMGSAHLLFGTLTGDRKQLRESGLDIHFATTTDMETWTEPITLVEGGVKIWLKQRLWLKLAIK